MNDRKMDVICKLNNIASAVCKMKDEKKFKKIETHVKKLNSTVERKKTIRKSPRKKKTISKSISNLSEPELDTSKYDSIDNTNLSDNAPVVASSLSNDFLENKDMTIDESDKVPPVPVEEPPVIDNSSPDQGPQEYESVPESPVSEPPVPEPSVPEPSVPEPSDPEPLKGGSLSRRFY